MDWQPIETAPKDGTKIAIYAKLWMAHNDTFIQKMFFKVYWFSPSGMSNANPHWESAGEKFPYKEWFVTHWSPMPESPK